MTTNRHIITDIIFPLKDTYEKYIIHSSISKETDRHLDGMTLKDYFMKSEVINSLFSI